MLFPVNTEAHVASRIAQSSEGLSFFLAAGLHFNPFIFLGVQGQVGQHANQEEMGFRLCKTRGF